LENTGNEIIRGISGALQSVQGAIAIVPHSNPDGDAIGAAYALSLVLKNTGREVTIVTPNDYPAFLNWMSGEVEIVNYLKDRPYAKQKIKSAAILFCVDFNEISRADDMRKVIRSFRGVKVLIDHHPLPAKFCDFLVSEPAYSSSAELVYDLIVALGLEPHIDKKTAEALYAGIMTDTGSFSYSTSRPSLYKVLYALTSYDIDTELIHSRVYDHFSAERFRLMGHCLLNKMVILSEYRTAYISLTLEEQKTFNFIPGDTEGFVNIPLSINNIVFSALFMEKGNLVKTSFRSKGSFPANEFASSHFGGGGHKNAAGGESKESLHEVIDHFTQLLPRYQHLLLNND